MSHNYELYKNLSQKFESCKSYLRNKKASNFIIILKNLSSKLISHLTNVIQIHPNSCQLAVVSKIQEFISDFSKPRLLTLKKNSKNGLYIHGSVGVGKSVIIKALKKIYPQSEILHFNDLIFKLQSRSEKNLSYLKNIKRKKLILIDEFFINNLTSFILFRKFVEEIKFNNTKIIMNGNKSLETVYNDLVNPKLCEKIKNELKAFFLIFKVKSRNDYRAGKAMDHDFFLIKKKNKIIKQNYIVSELSSERSSKQIEFNRKGNSFKLTKVYGNLIDLEFDDFFEKNLEFQDYNLIAKKIKIFVLRNIKQIDENKKNILARFISFIDVLYENKNILSISSNVGLDELYIGNTNSSEFKRTISRLKEMGTNKYINKNLKTN
mgnify:FL=1